MTQNTMTRSMRRDLRARHRSDAGFNTFGKKISVKNAQVSFLWVRSASIVHFIGKTKTIFKFGEKLYAVSYQNWTNKLNYNDHLHARQRSDAGFNKFGKKLSVKNAQVSFRYRSDEQYWELTKTTIKIGEKSVISIGLID